MFVFSNLALANRDLPAIIWCFVSRTGWRATSRIDVSVRHFDIAPSFSRLHSISSEGNRPTEYRGAVSVGAVRFRAATPEKVLTVPLRGCLVFEWFTRANRQEAEE
jgi:hypothetical protein